MRNSLEEFLRKIRQALFAKRLIFCALIQQRAKLWPLMMTAKAVFLKKMIKPG